LRSSLDGLSISSHVLFYSIHRPPRSTLFPYTTLFRSCMTVASLALAGFPLTSGFLSKDSIIVGAFEWGVYHGGWHVAISIILIIVSILTAFYIGRLICKAFFGEFKLKKFVHADNQLHDAPRLMLLPMVFLALCSFAPLFGIEVFSYHDSWLIQGLHLKVDSPVVQQAHLYIPGILTVGTLISWFIGWRWYVNNKYPFSPNNKLVEFANKQFYLNELNNVIFVKSTVALTQAFYFVDRHIIDGLIGFLTTFTKWGSNVAHWLDKNVIDGIVNFVARATYYLGHLVRHVQNGQLQGYIGFALTVVILGFLYLIIR